MDAFPPDVEVSLLAKDTSGRVLRFPVRATIDHIKAGDWQHVVVPLSARPAADAAQDGSAQIKGHLVEIGILVRARGRANVQGSVSFDAVRLLDASATFHVDATTQPLPPSQESWRLPPRLGVNIHLLRDDHALDEARAASFGFVRMDMMWRMSKGMAGIGGASTMRDCACWKRVEWACSGFWMTDIRITKGGVPRTPQDIAAFGQFAEAAAYSKAVMFNTKYGMNRI